MTVESAMYAILSNAGSSASDRFYPGRLPHEPTLPAGFFMIVSTRPIVSRPSIIGADVPGSTTTLSAEATLTRYLVQLELVAETHDEVSTLEAELTPYLSGFSGVAASENVSIVINEVGRDGFNIGDDLYRRVLDLAVWLRSA